jgi:hypothetical protein
MKDMPDKSKPIRILSVQRLPKTIYVAWQQGPGRNFDLNEPDNPLTAFNEAMDKLPALLCRVMEVPADWKLNVRPIGIVIGEINGVDTFKIVAQKGLAHTGKVMPLTTPPSLMGKPSNPEDHAQPFKPEYLEPIRELIEAAKEYIMGNRAPGTLVPIEGEEDDEKTEPKDGAQMSLGDQAAGKKDDGAESEATVEVGQKWHDCDPRRDRTITITNVDAEFAHYGKSVKERISLERLKKRWQLVS